MIRLFFLLGLGLFMSVSARAVEAPAPRAATSDEIQALLAAVKKYTGEAARWAYTETSVQRDDKGKVKKEIVVRYDPSEPPATRYVLISVDGKAPGSRDISRYRRRGEQANKDSDIPGTRARYSLGELIQFEAARIVAEDAGQLVFELPLRKENNNRFPPEKFLVLARVNKGTPGVEGAAAKPAALVKVEVRLREAFRQKLVVKVKSGEGTLDFTSVNPEFAPTLTSVEGDATVSVLFINVGGAYDLKRKDFKRVKPYDERFEVQIGELKMLDF